MESSLRELPWYKKWFDENYLALYNHRDIEDAGEQVALIINTLHIKENSLILDVGCGEGRYTFFLQNLGHRVVGLDLSETLIRCGKNKYPDLELLVADMRSIPFLPAKFDLILSLFTSFGYFERDKENAQVLESVYHSLKPGGIFWLDFLNAAYTEKNLVLENVSHILSCYRVIERRKIVDNRIIKDIYFTEAQPAPASNPGSNGFFNGKSSEQKKGRTKHYRESVRLFTKDELEALLEKAGFRLLGCFGDYGGESWREDSPRTIIYGRKEI